MINPGQRMLPATLKIVAHMTWMCQRRLRHSPEGQTRNGKQDSSPHDKSFMVNGCLTSGFKRTFVFLHSAVGGSTRVLTGNNNGVARQCKSRSPSYALLNFKSCPARIDR